MARRGERRVCGARRERDDRGEHIRQYGRRDEEGDGVVTDLGALDFGDGLDQIVGVIGVQP